MSVAEIFVQARGKKAYPVFAAALLPEKLWRTPAKLDTHQLDNRPESSLQHSISASPSVSNGGGAVPLLTVPIHVLVEHVKRVPQVGPACSTLRARTGQFFPRMVVRLAHVLPQCAVISKVTRRVTARSTLAPICSSSAGHCARMCCMYAPPPSQHTGHLGMSKRLPTSRLASRLYYS